MAYDEASLHRYDTYATYTIHLDGDERTRFLAPDDQRTIVTEILQAGGSAAQPGHRAPPVELHRLDPERARSNPQGDH